MRKIIDAHTHIFHAGLPGFTDPYVKTTFEYYGGMRFEDGSYFQKTPLFIRDGNFDADMLIRLMDAYGVQRAVIMQNGSPIFLESTIDAVKSYPGRLNGAMVLDMKDEGCLDEMERFAQSGLKAVKFDMNDDMGVISPHRFANLIMNCPLIYGVLDKAQKLGLTFVIDTGKPASFGYQTRAYDEITGAFHSVNFVICHLARPFYGMENDAERKKLVEEMWALAKKPNVWFDLAALPEVVSAGEAYPYPSAVRVAREFADRFGADKLIWGTDAPSTLSESTYRQLIDMYEKSELFSSAEKDALFYENALAAYRL